MQKSISNWLLSMIALLFCLSSFQPAFAQQEEKVLLFTHQTKNRAKFLKTGKRLAFWIKGDDQKKIGRIEKLKGDTVTIDGVEYKVESFAKFRGRSAGLMSAKVAGGLILATGTLSSGLGVIMIIQGQRSNDCSGAIAVLIGAVFTAGGLVLMAVGSIPFMIRGKTFNLITKWDLRIADVIPGKKKRKKQSWTTDQTDLR